LFTEWTKGFAANVYFPLTVCVLTIAAAGHDPVRASAEMSAVNHADLCFGGSTSGLHVVCVPVLFFRRAVHRLGTRVPAGNHMVPTLL
jgi:hypothetical protein